MISYNNGNIFDSDAEALVNPVNTQGVMGKGLALAFKKKFPTNYRRYREACTQKKFDVGQVLATREADLLQERLILNIATKKEWRNVSTIEYVESGVHALAAYIKQEAVPSVAIPALGCGLGGLKWTEVQSILEHALAPLTSCKVVIYPPK